MRTSVDGRESRDSARRRGGVYLIGLLAVAVACWIALAMAGDDQSTLTELPRRVDQSLVVDGNAMTLVTEAENPEDYKKVVDESPYPASDTPEKLTAEQLDAVAKLAPRSNKAGVQTHPAMVPLFRSMVLQYTGGTYKNSPLRFRLHTPEPYVKGKKYPMVVWLHGAGECGSDNVDQLSHLHHIIPYLTGEKKRDFFLLVPQCPHNHVAWEAPEICETKVRANGSVECHLTDDPVALGDAPVAFTLAMIDAVMKEFPVDPNRVTVAGLSTGGEGTWRILERRPELFAAAAPVVSWQAMHEKSLREKPLLKKIPIWAIYSSDDNGIDVARSEFERMREAGCRVFKTEFGVCGHRAWTPAMLQGDIFGWLISRAKDGQRYYVAEPSPTDPEKIGIFADVTEGDLKREPTKAVKPVVVAAPEPGPAATHTLDGPDTPQSPTAAVGRKLREAAGVPSPDAQPTAVRGGGNAVGGGVFSGIVSGEGTVVVTNGGTTMTEATSPSLPIATPYSPVAAPAVSPPSAGAVIPSPTLPTPPTPPTFGAVPYVSGSWRSLPSADGPSVVGFDQSRLQLIGRYLGIGDSEKALAVADKVKNRRVVIDFLLNYKVEESATNAMDYVDYERWENAGKPSTEGLGFLQYFDWGKASKAAAQKRELQREILDYVDRELDRMEQRRERPEAPRSHRRDRYDHAEDRRVAPKEKPLVPIPAGKKDPKDECGKEWAMSTTNQYGLFPNGWDEEAKRVPDYVLNETGKQLRERLAKAFVTNDLGAMKELCDTFIRLDDIPLSSPWFDTSGGRLQGRIKYALNEKAKPVVELLREIARVKAESKAEFAELARKAVERVDAITQPKGDE